MHSKWEENVSSTGSTETVALKLEGFLAIFITVEGSFRKLSAAFHVTEFKERVGRVRLLQDVRK